MRWVCPYCRTALDGLRCGACGRHFPTTPAGQPDFRLTGPITLAHAYRYDPQVGRFPWDRVSLEFPDAGSGLAADPSWSNLERRLLRAVPRVAAGEGLALDLGCGETRQRFRDGLVRLGYRTLGVDIAGAAPDALADLHRLPLPDASAGLLITSSVFEHLKHPHIAMAEAARVALPGARFVGNIAFGQPFHISYFHPSMLAAFDMLDAHGFEVETIVISDHYNAFYANLEMGFAGARMPDVVRRAISEGLRAIALAPAALRSALVRTREPYRAARVAFARSHSGEVGFVARRAT